MPIHFEPRRLDHADPQAMIARVQAYYAELYGSGDDGPLPVEDLAPPAGELLVAYDGSEPVAMIGWRRREVAGLEGPTVELKRMFVVDGRRGQGLGRLALAHVEDRLRAEGIATVVLLTGSLQVAATGLYASQGYLPLPDGVDRSWDPYVNDPLSVQLYKRL